MQVSKPSLGKYLRCAAATRSWRLELEMTRARARRLISTNQYVLFGHHFAANAGAGPLSGPVLAAQMGYLPGTLWILAGVVFAGAVQDFIMLFVWTRRDGVRLAT
jgi:uncharacterized membrane protein